MSTKFQIPAISTVKSANIKVILNIIFIIMHLMDSVLHLLQLLRYAYDSFTAMNKKLGLIRGCEFDIPHEVITYLLYSTRFEKSENCDLDYLFVEFIRIGYNPFRKNVSRQESIMVSSIVSIIDKQRQHNGNRSRKVSKKKTP